MIQDTDCWIKLLDVSLIPPTLNDNTADTDRFRKSLERMLKGKRVEVPFHLVKGMPEILRKYEYKCRAAVYREEEHWRVIDILPPDGKRRLYAIAADLGSSTVVLRFIDLLSGVTIDERSFLNPQHETGMDILTRIHYASNEKGIENLQKILVDRINKEIKAVMLEHGLDDRCLAAFAGAGNTAMTHFFLGLDPYWICREPYIPVVNSSDILTPQDVGLAINPGSPVIVMPGAGSYLGGDVTAGILSSGMTSRDEISLLVDVGTNAEVVLGNSEWLMACAGAAGPALEGGVAAMGMMAGPGAIDRVKIDPFSREINVRTIDNIPPAGICGSGLIDLAAQLFLSGMIDLRGKFNAQACGSKLIDAEGIKNLVIASSKNTSNGKDLLLSQPDLDSLLRSKAAMYTILKTITGMANMDMKDIERFYIAGTFGAYIDPESAISLGMIPDLPLSKYISIGNTSLEGVTMALLSIKSRRDIDRIKEMITYVELNVNQEFMNNFSAAKFIPHTDRSLFPSVKERD